MTVDNCVASLLQASHKLDVITKEKRNTDSVILFNPISILYVNYVYII